jgi:hypothetical protein
VATGCGCDEVLVSCGAHDPVLLAMFFVAPGGGRGRGYSLQGALLFLPPSLPPPIMPYPYRYARRREKDLCLYVCATDCVCVCVCV